MSANNSEQNNMEMIQNMQKVETEGQKDIERISSVYNEVSKKQDTINDPQKNNFNSAELKQSGQIRMVREKIKLLEERFQMLAKESDIPVDVKSREIGEIKEEIAFYDKMLIELGARPEEGKGEYNEI